jgi:hypothetical protein
LSKAEELHRTAGDDGKKAGDECAETEESEESVESEEAEEGDDNESKKGNRGFTAYTDKEFDVVTKNYVRDPAFPEVSMWTGQVRGAAVCGEMLCGVRCDVQSVAVPVVSRSSCPRCRWRWTACYRRRAQA